MEEPEKIFTRDKIDKELMSRYKRNPGNELKSIYQWNYHYLKRAICTNTNEFHGLHDLFTFIPKEETIYPRFRFLQNSFDPSGLATNAFG